MPRLETLKLQILSIYAYRYSAETVIKMHEPHGKLTKWQKKASLHAKENGPGNYEEKLKRNRIGIDRTKLA